MHKGSFGKMEVFKEKYLDENEDLLIIELGSLFYNGSCSSIFNSKNWKYNGVDVKDGEGVDILVKDYYDMSSKIMGGTVSVVLSGQLLERVPKFWMVFSEVSRILEPGGLFCLVSASSGSYGSEGDFYRFSRDGLIELCDMSGLQMVECITDNIGMWLDNYLVARKPAPVKPRKISRPAKKSEEPADAED